MKTQNLGKLKVGIAFSGQGSQYPQMGKELYDTFQETQDIFNQDERIKNWCFCASEEKLRQTNIKVKAYQEMIDKEKALADAKKFLEGLNYPVASASDLKSAEKAMIAARDAYEIAQANFEGVKLRAETDPERYQKKDALQKAMNAFFQVNNVYVYYRDGVGEAAKAQARAAVLTAQAAYDAAVRAYEDFGDLSYNSNELTAKLKEADKATTVADRRSPTAAISGTISEMNCEAGTYVQANDILAKIDDLNTLLLSD